jgi:hypothetical protein
VTKERGLHPRGELTPTSQLRLFEALLGLLGGLAANRPVVVVLEDVHWADASTRDLLVFLAHNLREVGLVLVASFRTDELQRQHPLRLLLPRLLREDTVQYLELAPLGRDEFALLLEDLSDGPPGPELLEALFERTQGNPFFAEQLVAAGGTCPDCLSRCGRCCCSRSRGCRRPTLRTLRVVAAAGGEHVGHKLVARVRRAVRPGPGCGVARGGGFRCPDHRPRSGDLRVPSCAADRGGLATMLPGEVGRVHRRLAQAIEEDPRLAVRSAAAELAHHWQMAQDQPRSLVASLDAAREAETAVGIDEASSHVERALELWDQVPGAHELASLEHGRAAGVGCVAVVPRRQPRRAIALQRAALAELRVDADLGRQARMLERLGEYLWEIGDGDGAVQARAEAVRLLPAEPPSPERARALASYSHILMLTGRTMSRTRPATRRCAWPDTVGDRGVEAAVLGTLGPSLAARGREDGSRATSRARAIAEELGDDLQVPQLPQRGGITARLGPLRPGDHGRLDGPRPGSRASRAARTRQRADLTVVRAALIVAGGSSPTRSCGRPLARGGIFAALNQLYIAYLAACRGEPERARRRWPSATPGRLW